MSRSLVALILFAVFGCGGSPKPAKQERIWSKRFEDLAPPPLHDAPLAAPGGPVQDEDDDPGSVPLYDDWGGLVDPTSSASTPGQAGASGPPTLAISHGEQVALVGLSAPNRRTFALRATLPVPDEYELPEAGRTNLLVRDRKTEALIPAQIEVVTRSPSGQPEVLEILALVNLSDDDSPRQRVAYEVYLGDEVLGRIPNTHPDVRKLLSPEGPGIVLRTRDVHGNAYEVDLNGSGIQAGNGSSQVLRQGPVARQRRTYGTLVPTKRGNGPPLPHMMGAHAYLTEWSDDERVTLDLRINNGASAGSASPHALELPLGLIYWEALELVLPRAWKIDALAADPFLGKARLEGNKNVIPIVKALPDNKLHMMGPQAQFHRRLTLVPTRLAGGQTDQPALEGLAFALPGPGLWSWFEPRTAHYFPQKASLPTWEAYRFDTLRGVAALRSRLSTEREQLADLLRSGKPDGNQVVASVMGWAHPWFVSDSGGAGSAGISPFQGHRVAAGASRPGYEKLLMLHRMNSCRQPEVQVNRLGHPLALEDWLNSNGKLPFDFRREARMAPPEFRLPALGGPESSPQVAVVHARKLRPPYDIGTAFRRGGRIENQDEELLHWLPHAGRYMARYTKFPQALVWLGNDALAKDDLLQSALLFQMQFHGRPHIAESWTDGVSLKIMEEKARANPHHGLPIGQDHAWGLDVACATYACADDGRRALMNPWFDRVADLFLLAVQPNGILQRVTFPGILGGRYASCQTEQVCFLMHGVRCMNESVFAERDESRRARLEIDQIRLAEYLFLGPVWFTQQRGTAGRGREIESGPRSAFAVAPPNTPEIPSFSDVDYWGERPLPEDGLTPQVEWWNIWSNLEYAALLDDPAGAQGLDNRFIRRASTAWFAPGSLPSLVERMYREAGRASNDDSGNWAGLVARLQQLSN